ncbi:MAG: hypothetical protein VW268_14215 [Rhodospirillaceae bacterium]
MAVVSELAGLVEEGLGGLVADDETLPVFVYHPEDGVKARLQAMRLGAARFLKAPIDCVDLLQLLAAHTDAAL